MLSVSQILKMIDEKVITEYVITSRTREDLRAIQKQIGSYKQAPIKTKTTILSCVDGDAIRHFLLIEEVTE